MKKLTSLLLLMTLESSVLFAQINIKDKIENKTGITFADVDPAARVNPHATT